MNLYNISPKEAEEVDVIVAEEEVTKKSSSLIVYNDDVNTFDWVIKALIDVCKHSQQQAEQLSMLVHFKGKATVKSGNLKDLRPMKDAITERGISAVIEES